MKLLKLFFMKCFRFSFSINHILQRTFLELEQIQLLPGHESVTTTERHLGTNQKLRDAVNDDLGIEIEFGTQGRVSGPDYSPMDNSDL